MYLFTLIYSIHLRVYNDLKVAINNASLVVVSMVVVMIMIMIVIVIVMVVMIVMVMRMIVAIIRVGSAINNFDGSVLLDPVNESAFRSVIIVINGALFIVGRVEFEGGETFNFEAFNFVSGGIHLGNDQVGTVLESFSKGFEDGGKSLAVTAPGSV